MAFVPLPDGVRVGLEATWNGQNVANVMHVTSADPIDEDKLADIATCFVAFFTEIAPMLHTSWALQRIVLTDVSTSGGAQLVVDGFAPLPGEDNTSASLVNNSAFVATLRSGLSGRYNRGRIYFAGLPVGALTAPNTLASTYVDNFLAALFNLTTCLIGINVTLVVASYRRNGAALTTAIAVPITGFTMNQVADSQRRRLPGRGS